MKDEKAIPPDEAAALLAANGFLHALLAPDRPVSPPASAANPDLGAQANIREEFGTNLPQARIPSAAPGAGTNLASTLQAIGIAQDKDTANIAEHTPLAGSSSDFSAALSAKISTTPPPQGENPPPATAEIRTPLQDSRWAQDFGSKIVWLAKADQQTAQLNINPPQLGPLQITLNLNGDQASALFISAHAEVRQVITDAMPQLREMLAGAGINLGEANVGTQTPNHQNSETPRFFNPAPSGDDKAILRADDGPEILNSLVTVPGNRGMVDLFA